MRKLCSCVLKNNRLCKNYKYDSDLCYIHYNMLGGDILEFVLIFIIALVTVGLINYLMLNDFDLDLHLNNLLN